MRVVFIYSAGCKAIGFHARLRMAPGEITTGLRTTHEESTQRSVFAPGPALTSALGLPASVKALEETTRTHRGKLLFCAARAKLILSNIREA